MQHQANSEDLPSSARQEHVLRIAEAWRSAVESIIETGSRLIDAKGTLNHGEFEIMVRNELPFSESTARKLMRIASHPIIANRAHVNDLPASWGTLYELSKLKREDLERAIEDGVVNSKMERKDAMALAGRQTILPRSEDIRTEVKCALCRETERKLPGHQWTENDFAEDQPASTELVDDLADQIRKFLAYPKASTLIATKRGARFRTTPVSRKIAVREKIERIIDTRERLVPEIVGELNRALRGLATTANELAERLEASTVATLDGEAKAQSNSRKGFDEAYVRHREAVLIARIAAYQSELPPQSS
ncbi:DUF3102 domain-containing protein [Bradyrhizobium monzae]|uniref:DUF3102 domain-containing protein n=1 Tax=Bradyrhizobium sp. Oc8 TaxID=2876780 RepID=UPI001F31A71D|nr:DUF3102 domain-containing protein [Bradyrhizobium sp. Oc8]